MDFTGERFIPLKELMDDEIAFEHLHRYYNSLNLVQDKVVLDIACGEGYGAAILAEKASKVYGVDIDKASIDHARNVYKKDTIEFLEGSATNIPIPADSIDVVISYETIEHIDEESQKEFLAEIKRVLKSDGLLIISTPDKENYTDRYSNKNEFHIKEFKRDEFVSFLKTYFENVSTYSQGYEIVDAITEEEPRTIQQLKTVDWPRNSKPFARKYILAVCTDIQTIENFNFSSVVFQVNKNFLEIMDGLVKKEAHILELGEWGRRLDKEIEEKNKDIRTLEEEKNILQQRLFQIEENFLRLQNSYSSYENNLAEKNLVVANQNQTITFLKTKIEEYSQSIQALEGKNNDKEVIIQKQKEKEQSLYLQLETVNSRLSEIYESDGWRWLKKYYNIKGRLLREDSKRYKFLKKALNKIRGKKEISQYGHNTTKTNQDSIPTEIINYDIITFDKYENPTVSIIIPVFNGWDITYRCLKSIHLNTITTSFEIIVADDGATDETRNIDQYIKNILVVCNEKNLGFLNNCNNAAKRARGKYILFLNNDTEVRPRWLSALTDLMDEDESIGMSGSKLIYPDGKLQEAGGIIWKDASAWNFGHTQDPEAPQFNYLKEADYISGAAIAIRSSLWNEIGGFDTRYAPAYCEDSDLAFEVRKKGFKVVYQPLSEVVHYEGYSHGVEGQQGAIKEYQQINNMKLKEKWNDVLKKEHFPNGENVFWARDRSRNKKTILVIDHYVPQYDKDAGSRTVFQYLGLFVSMNMNVKFFGDNFYRHEPYTTTLQQMGIEVLYGLWYAENWKQWIKDNHDKFDYILLNRPHITIKYIDFIKANTKAKILYYGHDLHFVRELKQYDIEKNPALLESAEKWKKMETDIFRKSDIVLAPSMQECEQIKALGIENVLPIKPFIFTVPPALTKNFSNKNNVLFVGGFSHLPNVDAITWFVREIWPVIINVIPEVKFIIVGSNPPPVVKDLQNDNIEVLGYVSDEELNKLYATIRIAVIPLRYGAGVKGKTVEAMYNGLPLVTTSFGIEGLPGIASIIHAMDSAEDFANEVIRVYNLNNSKLEETSRKETDYISSGFMFENVKKELTDIFGKLDRKTC